MRFKIKHIIGIMIILIIALNVLNSTTAYTGTGFNHNISFEKYSELSSASILDKYNDTSCNKEVSGICTYVVDGDTIFVEGVGKIRFVGVNTPERGDYGYSTSKEFVKKLCLNKEVSLDIDNSKKTDKYGRTLAVVIVGNKNLNEMLLKENLAEVMYIPPSEFNPYTWSPKENIINDISTISQNNLNSLKPNNIETVSGDFVASKNSGKFHKINCIWAMKISEGNKIIFKTNTEAINQGYQPCKVCNP